MHLTCSQDALCTECHFLRLAQDWLITSGIIILINWLPAKTACKKQWMLMEVINKMPSDDGWNRKSRSFFRHRKIKDYEQYLLNNGENTATHNVHHKHEFVKSPEVKFAHPTPDCNLQALQTDGQGQGQRWCIILTLWLPKHGLAGEWSSFLADWWCQRLQILVDVSIRMHERHTGISTFIACTWLP